MTGAGVVILDVDGVILDERPYWDVALATALAERDLRIGDESTLNSLCRIAYEELAMQRLCKKRGCNSNWDLAATLAVSLTDEIGHRISRSNDPTAMRDSLTAWAQRISDRWEQYGQTNGQGDRFNGDPLLGFGIDREGAFFRRCAERFQAQLAALDRDDVYDSVPCAPREPETALRDAIERLVSGGFEVRILTGRFRRETEIPLRRLNLLDLIGARQIFGHDQIVQSQQRLGQTGLGKPHWFGAALALFGHEVAAQILDGGDAPGFNGRCVYVGDGMADFLLTENCRPVGINLQYVHVRSGITERDEERQIVSSPQTIAIVDRLSSVPDVLGIAP